MKKLLPWLAALAAVYLLLPLLITGSGSAMLVLLTLLPLAAFVWGVLYGVREGGRPGLAVWGTVMFLPAVLLHYNSSALVYAPVYGVIALIGNVVGALFYKRKR